MSCKDAFYKTHFLVCFVKNMNVKKGVMRKDKEICKIPVSCTCSTGLLNKIQII